MSLNRKYYPGYEHKVPGGKLIYLEKIENGTGGHRAKWQCYCGSIFETCVYNITGSECKTKSCGCWKKLITDKKIKDISIEYLKRLYSDIKQRCYNPNNTAYKNYGGSDIAISIEWINNCQKFIEDILNTIGHRPNKFQLDRINNNGNYEINNLKWSSPKENCRNKRNNKLITINNETKTLSEWEEISGIDARTISTRFEKGLKNLELLKPIKIYDKKPFDNTNFKSIYYSIKTRCFNKNRKQYLDYGARGITISDLWKNSYHQFQQDIINLIGVRPSEKHYLDRYPNNDGNYEPGNIRWASAAENNTNKRDNILIEINGDIKTASEWGNIYNLPIGAINRRFNSGISGEKLLEPIIKQKFNYEQVEIIKNLYKNNKSIVEISILYNVIPKVITDIIRERGAYTLEKLNVVKDIK